MLLYDLPLLKQSLSIKCLGGLFTKTRQIQLNENKNQNWLPRKNYQIIIAKNTSFELYRFKKTTKADKIDMTFYLSTDVFGQICNIQTCSVKISQTRQFIDIVIVTLNSGQLLVYYFSKEAKSFTCVYRDIIFKDINQSIQLDNIRNIGNYITCSQLNHFLISSIRCHRKLYSINATLIQNKIIKVNVQGYDFMKKNNQICWNIIWLPSMNHQSQYLGKYVAIQKEMATSNNDFSNMNNGNRKSSMIDENQERQIQMKAKNPYPKKLKYFYVDKRFKIIQKDQKKKSQFQQLRQSSHMLIPISSSSFFILYDNKMYLKQLNHQNLKQDTPLVDLKIPLRDHLVDTINLQTMFTYYARQPRQNIDGGKNKIYFTNQFGDIFQLEYVLVGSLISNFSVRYTNSMKTVHSFVYIGQIEAYKENVKEKQNKDNKDSSITGKISLWESGQSIILPYQQTSVLLFGLQRFSTSLYFLPITKNLQGKPKQIKANVRANTKSKSINMPPKITDPQIYKPIIERSRDLQLSYQIQHMGVIVDTKVVSIRNQPSQQMKEGKDHNRQKQQCFEIYSITNGGNLRHQQHIDTTSENIQTHRSYLKIIKKGLKVHQTNSFPYIKPINMYCFRKYQKQNYQNNHKFIVICSQNKTTAYTITSKCYIYNYVKIKVETNLIQINKLIWKKIQIQSMLVIYQIKKYLGKFQDQSYVQILPAKIRFIRKQKNGIKEFIYKPRAVIAFCTGKQLFIGFIGGQISYYQLDKEKQIIQVKKQFYADDQIISMQGTPLQKLSKDNPQKRISKYLVVASKNYELTIYRIKGQKQISIQKVYTQKIIKNQIESVCITARYTEQGLISSYQIFLGLHNGNFIKMQFDRNMIKVNQKVFNLGTKPCKIKKIFFNSKKQDSVLIITDKTYVYYYHKNKYIISLVASQNVQLATQLRQNDNSNNLIIYSQGNLRFLTIQTFGEDFHQQKSDLFFSGKKLLMFENNIGIIQADPSYYDMNKNSKSDYKYDLQNLINSKKQLEKVWRSQFNIYKGKNSKRVSAIYFDQTRQICLSAAYNYIKTGNYKGAYLIFGCAQGITYYPKFQTKNQTIKVYSWINEQNKNQFLYSLNIDAVPFVLQPFFKGEKFLAGIGNSLRLYEIGKKKLLMKASIKNLSSNVNQIKTYGKKIYVTFVSDSFHLYKYIPEQHTFYDIAEDNLPKYITAMNVLDSQTVCAADKFGNIMIGRLSQNAKNHFQNLTTINSSNVQTVYKFNTIARINVGDIVTSITKTNLYNSKIQVIIYSTIMGQLRILYPVTEYDQVKILSQIQQSMIKRLRLSQVTGNNYNARSKVISGQIVQKFISLSKDDQISIIKQIKGFKIQNLDYIKEKIQGIRSKII